MISISITFGMFLIISSIVLILKKEENISPVLRVICLILISSHIISLVDLPLSLLASFGILLNKRNLVKLYVILRMFLGIVLVICSVIFSVLQFTGGADPKWLLLLL